MTRFMMSIDGAVDLVLFAFEHGHPGDIFVQKAPAATIETLALAMRKVLNAENPVQVIGTRHGEKLYETLLTREEFAVAEDLGRLLPRAGRQPRPQLRASSSRRAPGGLREGRLQHPQHAPPVPWTRWQGCSCSSRSSSGPARASVIERVDAGMRQASALEVLVTGAQGFIGRNLMVALGGARASQ